MEVDCQEEFSSPQVHNGKSQTVNGSTRMYLGDMIHLVIPKSEIGKVKDLLL